MKILTMPTTLTNLQGDGVIIGIEGLSTNMPAYFKIEALKDIKKEIFISLNKNMLNSDLPLLEETLLALKKYPIQGIIFYDVAIVNMCRRLQITIPLIWAQEHSTTNYDTVNFWYEQGVKIAYISSDITLREMLEIKKEAKSKLMVNVFGYLPMFTSKRHLVQNYLETFKINNDSNIYYMKKEGKTYPIIDKEETIVYTDFIVDGLKESLLLNYDYIVLNSFQIDEQFDTVVSLFMNLSEKNYEERQKQLNALFPNLEKGFFYEETVYKVK